MDDPRWLRLVTIGLVLAAIAVGYFLFTARFSTNKIQKAGEQPKILGQNTSPVPVASPLASPQSAYNQIVNRTKGGVEALPATGFPVGLVGMFSAGAVIAGWGLRRFPH